MVLKMFKKLCPKCIEPFGLDTEVQLRDVHLEKLNYYSKIIESLFLDNFNDASFWEICKNIERELQKKISGNSD
jgi:hypothetical protein